MLSQLIRAGCKFLAGPQLCVSLIFFFFLTFYVIRFLCFIAPIQIFKKQEDQSYCRIEYCVTEALLHCLLSLCLGLPGAEVRRRSFSIGHELLRQIFSYGTYQKV